MKYGIDVCSYQGNIDWARVKKAGCAFAVLKCIRKDMNPDTAFARNVAGCEAQKIPADVYTYVYENTAAGAEKRAKAAVKACKAQGLKGCTIWWDVEDKSIRKSGAKNRKKLTESVLAAKKVIEGAGYGFGVYCDRDFYTGCLNAQDIGGRWWIASYGPNRVTAFGAAPERKKPVIAGALWGWQYCSRGQVPGIRGSVDLDVVYGAVSAQETPQKDGNPYPEPTGTLTSTHQAAEKGLHRWIPQGPQVKWVQWELNRLGYDLGPAGVDGKCGKKTVAAIEAFQRGAGLTVDGLCGVKTWAALKAAKEKPVEKTQATGGWLTKVANGAKKVYDAVVKHRCRHKGGADTLEEIIEKRITTCSSSVTAALKEAGLMKTGKLGHRPKDGKDGKTKTTPEKVFYGLEYLDKSKVDIVMVDKLYKDLPEKYKRPGVIYGQDSNICISAGDGEIYSTNEGSSQMRDGVYVKDKVDKGYPYSHRILAVIVPKE